METIKRQTMHM